MNAYVMAGPAVIGNAFGYHGKEVPADRFAVVVDGEYANGGHGPSQEGPLKLFASAEEAQAVANSLNEECC